MIKSFPKLSKLPSREEKNRLESFLALSNTPLLFGHISPDGDSIGSCLAMMHLLRARGKKPRIAMAGHVPGTLKFLPGSDEILLVWGEQYPKELEEAFKQADLFFCLDFNTPSRLGKVLNGMLHKAINEKERPLIAVDHHEDPSDEFNFIISKPTAAATCEILTDLFRCKDGSKNELSKVVSTALLTGIITDTGLFNHSSSYPEIFEATAELIRCEADKTQIINEVFHRYSKARFNMEGYVRYKKITVLPELKTAYFSLSLEEQKTFELVPGDTEGLVNIPLDMDGIEISAFFKETLYEGIKVSLRSKGNLVVNDIARDGFGGGGHEFAAGAEFEGNIDQAISQFINYVKTHKAHEIATLNQQINQSVSNKLKL